MQIEVNGLTEAAPPEAASLGDVVAGLRRVASTRRLVVGGIVLDGEPLTPEREKSFAGRPAAEFRCLTAEVVEPARLLREVFLGLEGAISGIASGAAEAGGRIRLGESAGPLVAKVAEELAFVIDAYQAGLRMADSSGLRAETGGGGPLPAADPSPGLPGGEACSRIEDVLNEVVAGLASGDMVSLGDALEHQFAPALEALLDELRGWRSALGAGKGSPESGASR